MQFNDLQKQYEHLEPQIKAKLDSVLHQGQFVMGPDVVELETALSNFVGVKNVITCDNGTNALVMSLRALGVTQGDAVFVPSFTFFATAEAVSILGAIPIFVDVNDSTFNICQVSLAETIERTIQHTKLKAKAIIPVDLFGLPANYPELRKVSDKYNLKIVEDGAQGLGGGINEKHVCSFGDISTTSFFPSKPLGCYGDGGAIFTEDDNISNYIKSIRAHGRGEDKYDNIEIGYNSRLDTIQAAILLVKMTCFNQELKNRQRAAQKYNELLKNIVKTPVIPEGYMSAWAQYTIQVFNARHRDKLIGYLNDNAVPAMVYYPKPLHLQRAYEAFAYRQGSLPVSERLSKTVLSLPMNGYITEEHIENVCWYIREFYHKHG